MFFLNKILLTKTVIGLKANEDFFYSTHIQIPQK